MPCSPVALLPRARGQRSVGRLLQDATRSMRHHLRTSRHRGWPGLEPGSWLSLSARARSAIELPPVAAGDGPSTSPRTGCDPGRRGVFEGRCAGQAAACQTRRSSSCCLARYRGFEPWTSPSRGLCHLSYSAPFVPSAVCGTMCYPDRSLASFGVLVDPGPEVRRGTSVGVHLVDVPLIRHCPGLPPATVGPLGFCPPCSVPDVGDATCLRRVCQHRSAQRAAWVG
jgi:hypothetical protein